MKQAVYTRPLPPANLPRRKGMAQRLAEMAERKPPAKELQSAPLTVDKTTEAHITPPDVAARMVDYLGDVSGDILEPSAGTGALVRALIEAGADPARIKAVERYQPFRPMLEAAGVVPLMACALEAGAEHLAKLGPSYDRVLMNPPFRKARQHIAMARALMRPGGRLVALVPVTFEADGAEWCEDLPAGTFATAPGVTTKIIEIEA